jgi:hypothetical protein
MLQSFSHRALIVAAVLAMGIAGCGDDSGANDGGQGTGAEGEIKAVVAQMQERMKDGDSAGICALLTARGQKATARQGRSKNSTCEQATTDVIEIYGDNLHRSLNVVKLRVDGTRALATFKAETGNTYDTRFVEADGQWKFDRPLVISAN